MRKVVRGEEGGRGREREGRGGGEERDRDRQRHSETQKEKDRVGWVGGEGADLAGVNRDLKHNQFLFEYCFQPSPLSSNHKQHVTNLPAWNSTICVQ